MKYIVLIFMFFYVDTSFSMSIEQIEKKKGFFWKRLLGVELQHAYLVKQLELFTDQAKTPHLALHERAGLVISSHYLLGKCRKKWDAITMEMAETHLFNDDELSRALVDDRDYIFKTC